MLDFLINVHIHSKGSKEVWQLALAPKPSLAIRYGHVWVSTRGAGLASQKGSTTWNVALIGKQPDTPWVLMNKQKGPNKEGKSNPDGGKGTRREALWLLGLCPGLSATSFPIIKGLSPRTMEKLNCRVNYCFSWELEEVSWYVNNTPPSAELSLPSYFCLALSPPSPDFSPILPCSVGISDEPDFLLRLQHFWIKRIYSTFLAKVPQTCFTKASTQRMSKKQQLEIPLGINNFISASLYCWQTHDCHMKSMGQHLNASAVYSDFDSDAPLTPCSPHQSPVSHLKWHLMAFLWQWHPQWRDHT